MAACDGTLTLVCVRVAVADGVVAGMVGPDGPGSEEECVLQQRFVPGNRCTAALSCAVPHLIG